MEKIFSMVVAAGYVVATYQYVDAVILLPVCVLVILPLVGIWFAPELASYFIRANPGRRRLVPPTYAVRALAWLLLLVGPATPLIWFFWAAPGQK